MRTLRSFAGAAAVFSCFCLGARVDRAQQDQRTATPEQAPSQPSANPTTGTVIVVDPAHGGTDSGARGGNGAIEKDIVLQYARGLQTELERAGFRVVLTREDDSNPSYDDRAAMANTYRDMIFVSLHVSSSGEQGTVRAYYYRFGSYPAEQQTDGGTPAPIQQPASTMVLWERAQASFADSSHRLADALQSEFAQKFSGSPMMPSATPVRELRSIGGPAVAVEVSSVSVSNPDSLSALGSPLAAAIVHALTTFRSTSSGASN